MPKLLSLRGRIGRSPDRKAIEDPRRGRNNSRRFQYTPEIAEPVPSEARDLTPRNDTKTNFYSLTLYFNWLLGFEAWDLFRLIRIIRN